MVDGDWSSRPWGLGLGCLSAACPSCLDLVRVGKGEKSKPHLASLTLAAAPVVAQFCIKRPSSDIFF